MVRPFTNFAATVSGVAVGGGDSVGRTAVSVTAVAATSTSGNAVGGTAVDTSGVGSSVATPGNSVSDTCSTTAEVEVQADNTKSKQTRTRDFFMERIIEERPFFFVGFLTL